MKYLYYPGCSLEGSAQEYNISTKAVLKALGAELLELSDWSCCGASAAAAISPLLALALPARNLAIAEKISDVTDILVPCSACYLNLKKVEETIRREPGVLVRLNAVLETENLKLSGRIRVRHLLDVLSRDIDVNRIGSLTEKPLSTIRIAPYYGCQCLRPYPVFDNPEKPVSMNPLIEAAGARVHPWAMGGVCCGASNLNTHPSVGISLVTDLLKEARSADAIVTVCPMCQLNLEGYQNKASGACNADLQTPVLYLPQLLGIAFGLPGDDIRLDLNLSANKAFRKKCRQ
ncbi:MAG: CoB--CoM heterodisulfide reductase iron-sulfur subunit B family protein [Deltaproteobacteria bacterium]|nr:CoB--CoM heterodisulfide reductase iron-sulfur subunit B family protein [Deltaproteobacteria bacterium]